MKLRRFSPLRYDYLKGCFFGKKTVMIIPLTGQFVEERIVFIYGNNFDICGQIIRLQTS